MKTLVHRGDTRGHANHGWLETYHTFSFADYFNQERIHFGALRVLNDDWVKGGEGFGRHPHDNMEIVTIMLEGELKHSDSMGHTQILHENEVQAMSAGTGIFHSEVNNSPNKPLRLLQIWVFPEQHNIEPRYEQKAFDSLSRKNNWQLLAGPNARHGEMDIKQQAWFSRIDLEKDKETTYDLYNKQNGIYLFVISGTVKFGGEQQLQRRDGAGIWEVDSLKIRTIDNSELLVIEVPMIE
jgi:redox-sensitive bicupin YhaK (pirin superfamily)